MKRLWRYFWTILVFYLILSFAINYFKNGHDITYTIIQKQGQIVAFENYKKDSANDFDIYKIKLKIEKEEFEFQILNKYTGETKILSDVKYVKDKNYKCILPIFDSDKILMDITCKDKNDIYYNYSDIKDKSDKLKKFAGTMNKYNYNKTKYIDNKNQEQKNAMITLYPSNIVNNLVFGITNYRGIYILSENKLKNIKLFDNDVYQRNISTFVGDYYLVADYNQKYDFDKILLVNLKNGTKKEIILKDGIPNDSYIAGVIENDVYLVDKSNKKQYRLSIDSGQVKEVGNEHNDMLIYQDGKLETVPYTRMTLKNTYFDKNVKKVDGNYTLFLKTNGNIGGYNYYYQKKNDEYQIYRSTIGSGIKKYLFKTNSIDKTKCEGNYIFYQDKNEIKYYSDETGVRTLLLDSELEFNKNILYGIYEK